MEKVNALSDEKTERMTRTERLFLEQIGGDCHMPIGGYATETADGRICLAAIFGNEDGSRSAARKPEMIRTTLYRLLWMR